MKLSVIVPVYNSEKFLPECIESILNQTFADFELILIDDGATDSSGKICDDYANKDRRIKVLHKDNAGQSQARNDGIRLAKGEYILMIDSDDFIASDMCTIMVEYAEKYGADCVCTGYERLMSDGSTITVNEADKIEIYSDHGEVKNGPLTHLLGAEYKDTKTMMPSACTKLYRKEIITENNIQFLNVKQVFSEDLLFNFHFLSEAEKVVCLPQIFYTYRENTVSTSHSYNSRRQDAATNLFKELKKHPYISENLQFRQMAAAEVMGLYSVHIKLLIAGDDKGKIRELKKIMNDDTIHEMACLCKFSKIKFPLNLFCVLIKYKMKYTLYLLIKLFLIIR